MRLLHTTDFTLHEFFDDRIPPYAILSHRWGDHELSYADAKDDKSKIEQSSKIMNSCRIAVEKGLQYIWIDTCCIDKSSSAELTEAINSMFRWYQMSEVCLIYLNDVSVDPSILEEVPEEHYGSRYEPKSTGELTDAVAQSIWFTRGWTLQELIAPHDCRFYDRSWNFLGNRSYLSDATTEAAGISDDDARSALYESVAERMSWASHRKTSREEDVAYCLLGLFEVNMPLLYGEGAKRAFYRLQMEIIRQSNDETIFAWHRDRDLFSGMLADLPIDFAKSAHASTRFRSYATPYNMTQNGLYLQRNTRKFYPCGPHGPQLWIADLNCKAVVSGFVFNLLVCLIEIPDSGPAYAPSNVPKSYWRFGPLLAVPEESMSLRDEASQIAKTGLYVRQFERDSRLPLWADGAGWHSDFKCAEVRMGVKQPPETRYERNYAIRRGTFLTRPFSRPCSKRLKDDLISWPHSSNWQQFLADLENELSESMRLHELRLKD